MNKREVSRKINKKVKQNNHRLLLQIYLIIQHFNVSSPHLLKLILQVKFKITLTAVKSSKLGKGQLEPAKKQ
jgi:hypothetical protein